MKKLPEIQVSFFLKKFIISEQDLPDYYDKSYYAETIICKWGAFRGDDYEGNGESFRDEVWQMRICSNINADNKRLEAHLLYIEKLSILLEYYELAYNLRVFLNEIHRCRIDFLGMEEGEEAEEQVSELLLEMNLCVQEDLVEDDFDDLPF